MAEVYRVPQGRKVRMTKGKGDPLYGVVARHVAVQAAVAAQASSRAGVAKAVLGAHRDSGASEIVVTNRDVDYVVSLVDRSPKPQPRAIEFGREGGRGGVGALQRAFPESRAMRRW